MRLTCGIDFPILADDRIVPGEAVHAGAEQAYRPAPGFGALEQRQRARNDLARVRICCEAAR